MHCSLAGASRLVVAFVSGGFIPKRGKQGELVEDVSARPADQAMQPIGHVDSAATAIRAKCPPIRS